MTRNLSAYLRGNGFTDGFLQLYTSEDPPAVVEMFKDREIGTATFAGTNAQGTDELVVFYDAGLHKGAPGLIKCPYLIRRRTVKEKRSLDLTIDHEDNIMAAIDNMKAEQELIPGEYTTRIITAYFIAAGQWSSIVPITISETDNGNFYIPSLGRMFPEPGRVKMGTLEVTNRDEGGSKRLFCVFDRNQHNNGTDDCPYLILGFSHDYHLDNMTEENIMDVAYAIDMLQKKVPQNTDDE